MHELGAKEVLVVEDDADTAELERRALARAGIVAHLASSVREAKALLKAHPVQAVLLDHKLPDGDSWEIVALAQSLTPPVPVVLVTAMGSERLVAEAIRRGVADYIRKSDTFWDQLATTVHRVAKLAQAETRLRHSNSLFQLIAAHATDLIVTLDPAGRIRWMSPASRRFLDRDASDLIGSRFVDLVHPQDREHHFFDDYTSDRSLGRRDIFRCCRQDGACVWVEADFQLVRDAETGLVTEVLGVLRDISERRSAEDKLRESEQRFRGSFEAAAHGMALVSTEGRWLEVNRALCEIVGYSEQELLATDFQAITHPDDLETDLDYVRRLMAGTIDNYQMEKRYFHKMGHTVWILLSVSLVRDAQGRPVHFVAQILNVTAAREAEQALRLAKEEAERANSLKSGFLATMSHEIRTPMNGILGFADILLRTGLTAEQRRAAMLLRDAGASLLAIINDILDLSKIEAGKLQLETHPLNVADLVNGAISIVGSEAAAKGLELRTSIDPGLSRYVEGDSVRLRQVLLNLLSNAIKFTDRGRITVRVVATTAGGDTWSFEVQDTGMGIAPDSVPLLFEEFSQVDRSITRRYGGTGLGLAICKRLIEAMPKGRIGVESEVGLGSRFWFTIELPAAAAPVGRIDEPAGAAHVSGAAPARILVAEDNYINQVVIEHMLTDAGHTVVVVPDGRAAVEAVRTRDFDLVLMDMEMPELDGIAAARQIRQLAESVHGIPIIALTANAMPEEAARCRAAGMNEHLSKPIDREKLLRAITRWSSDGRSAALPSKHTDLGTPCLDIEVISDLERTIGCDKVVRLIALFRVQLEKSIAVMGGSDARGIAREAHVLVSTAGTLGFTELMSSSRELMLAIDARDGEIASHIASVERAAARAGSLIDAEYA